MVVSFTGSSSSSDRSRKRELGDCRLSRLVVLVVALDPLMGCGLRVSLRRVFPLLLSSQRRDVEVAVDASYALVAAAVEKIGEEDPGLVVAKEHERGVPLVGTEVGVEVVRDRVPGEDLPAHSRSVALDLGLRGARDERERGVPCVQMSGVVIWSASREHPVQPPSGQPSTPGSKKKR